MPPISPRRRAAQRLAGSDRTDAHFACTAGRADLLEDAMAIRVDLSQADKDGMTALHCACTRGARGCVRLLLEAAGDTKARHRHRITPAWVDARDGKGRTALHHAAKRGDPGVVEMLVNAGAEVAATDAASQTPAEAAGSPGAFAALAAATREVDRLERVATAILRGQVARARAPGGVYKLLEDAKREEAQLEAETALLSTLHREAEANVLLQRQLNLEAAAEQKKLERRETRRLRKEEAKAAEEKLMSDRLDKGIAPPGEAPRGESFDEWSATALLNV